MTSERNIDFYKLNPKYVIQWWMYKHLAMWLKNRKAHPNVCFLWTQMVNL